METFPSSHEIEELTEESKIDQNLEKKLILPLKKNHPIGDDINRLFEAIEIGSSRHNGIDRHLERRKHLSKRAMKRPMRFGAPQVSGIGISEPVSLKQALRGLCISQASEMAAMKKRMSRTLSSSPGPVPETVAIDKLYRAVVIKSSEMGNLDKKGKMGFLEISLVPERSPLNVSEKACGSGNAFKGEVSEKNDAVTEPEIKDDDFARVSAIVASGEPEQIGTSELTACSSSGNKLEQRFPEMDDDNSTKENRQIKNLASETVSSKTFNVENKLLMSSRRGLMSRRRSRTQNFVKNKIVPKTTPGPKSQIQHDQRAKSSHDYNFGKFFHESSESLRTNQSEKVDHTVDASAISKIMKTDLVTSNSNIDKHGIVEHLSNKTVNIVTKSLEKGEISQSSKSSNGDYSSTCTTNHSKESYLSGGSSNSGSRPHVSKNLRWEAINHVKKEHGNLSLQHFKLMKKIGVGDIGTVYLSELIGTSCLFAVKVMDNEFLSNRNKSMRATTEKMILESLDHPFLPTLYAHFETKKFSCLVMDYCPGGDLHVLRQKQMLKCFPEKAVRFYVAEVLLAIEYLHMLGVVYRDLKPENILVREDGHIMLSDFDLSLMCSNVNPTLLHSTSPILTKKTTSSTSSCSNSSCIDPFCLQSSTLQLSCFTPRFLSKTRKLRSDLASQIIPLPQIVVEPTNARSNSFVGTHEYLAPEIIKGEGHGSSVDWWALGIFLYELLYGKTPFKGSNNEETISNVVSENLKFPQTTPLVSSHARDLMRKLLTKEPENRLGSLKGAVEIKQHVFFEGLNWALIRCETPPDMTKLLDTSKSGKSQCDNGCRRDEEARFEMF